MKSSMTDLSELVLCSPIYVSVHKLIPGAYTCRESCMVAWSPVLWAKSVPNEVRSSDLEQPPPNYPTFLTPHPHPHIYGLKLRYVECIYYGSKVGDCT